MNVQTAERTAKDAELATSGLDSSPTSDRSTQFTNVGLVPPVESDADAPSRPTASELAYSDGEPPVEIPELSAETSATTAAQQQDDKPAAEPSLRIKVPLSEATKASARLLYAQWVKTGVVPPLADLREKISLDWIQVAGPMDRVRASMLYPQFKITDPDAELLAELVGLRALPDPKSRGKGREPIPFYWVASTAAVYKELRVGRDKPPTNGGAAPRLETGTSSETWSWIGNLLIGDFNKDPDTAQTVINGIAGLIPGLDQVLDARDLTANLYELVYEGRYNEAGPWFNFVTTLIGAIPEVGSVVKTVGRVGAKGVGNLGGPLLRMVAEWASDTPRLAGFVMEQAQRSFESVIGNLETVLATVGRLSAAAREWITRLLDNAKQALAQLATRADAAIRKVKERLDELVASVRRTDEPLGDAPVVRTESPDVEVPATTRQVDATPTRPKDIDDDINPTEQIARQELADKPLPKVDATELQLNPVNANGHRNAGLYSTEVGGSPAFVKVLNQGDADDLIELATSRRLSDLGVGPRVLGETVINNRRALITEQITDGVPVGVSTPQLRSQNLFADSPGDRLKIVEELERFGPLVESAGIEVSRDLQFLWSPSAKRLYMIDAQKAELLPTGKAARFTTVEFNNLARDLREIWGLAKQ